MRFWPKGGYPSGDKPAGELKPPPANICKPKTAPSGLFRQSFHDCILPIVTGGGFRFVCPVCSSTFDSLHTGAWMLDERVGAEWIEVAK